MRLNEKSFFRVFSIDKESEETRDVIANLPQSKFIDPTFKVLCFDGSETGQQSKTEFFHNAEGALKRVKRLRTLLQGNIVLDDETIEEIISALKGTEEKIDSLRTVLKEIFD